MLTAAKSAAATALTPCMLNALPIHGPRSGVGHYTAELLRCLLAQARPEEQIRARYPKVKVIQPKPGERVEA